MQFDVNLHSISLLDDMLLILCLPAFFLFSMLQMTAAVLGSDNNDHDDHGRVMSLTNPSQALTIVKILFYIIQVMIQTPMIIDGLRRCSNSFGSQGKPKFNQESPPERKTCLLNVIFQNGNTEEIP